MVMLRPQFQLFLTLTWILPFLCLVFVSSPESSILMLWPYSLCISWLSFIYSRPILSLQLLCRCHLTNETTLPNIDYPVRDDFLIYHPGKVEHFLEFTFLYVSRYSGPQGRFLRDLQGLQLLNLPVDPPSVPPTSGPRECVQLCADEPQPLQDTLITKVRGKVRDRFLSVLVELLLKLMDSMLPLIIFLT